MVHLDKLILSLQGEMREQGYGMPVWLIRFAYVKMVNENHLTLCLMMFQIYLRLKKAYDEGKTCYFLICFLAKQKMMKWC